MVKTETYDIPETYEEAVRLLAEAHVEGEEESIRVFLIPDEDEKIVRIIEVSDIFPEAAVQRPVPGVPDDAPEQLERIVPVFPMGPSRDYPYRSEVAMVTEQEWQQLHEHSLKLNRDWDLEQAQEVHLGK
jgi:hypothetical protein